MKPKVIYAVLASAATGFFLGWLIWGIALMDFYTSNMIKYEGLMKEPPIWVYVVSNLGLGILWTYVLHHLAGIRSFGKAFVAAMIMTFLSILPYEIMFYTGMNLYSGSAIVMDIVASTLMGGLMGGVAVLVASMGKEA